MKAVAIVFLIACGCIFSCTKTAGLISKDDFAGTWLLKKYDGGYSYQVIIPTDVITITFDRTGKFTSSANFSIPPNGDYNISKDIDGYHYSDIVINLFADNYDQITYGVKIKTDTLFLFDGCCDMFRYTYIRQK